jgi:hypothetical protein
VPYGAKGPTEFLWSNLQTRHCIIPQRLVLQELGVREDELPLVAIAALTSRFTTDVNSHWEGAGASYRTSPCRISSSPYPLSMRSTSRCTKRAAGAPSTTSCFVLLDEPADIGYVNFE